MTSKRKIITSQSSTTVTTKTDSSCMPTTVVNNNNLDDNILSEILIRLPAKTLGRLKVINKRWYSLISDPFFLNKHTSLQTNRNAYTYFLDSYAPAASVIRLSPYPFSLDIPSKITIPLGLPEEYGRAFILASCHGLLLVKLEFQKHICVLNPLTKKTRLIPSLSYKNLRCWYGLVFGPTSSSPHYYNNYNVVCLVVGHKMFKFKIFDQKKGQWRDSKKTSMIIYGNGHKYYQAGRVSTPVCCQGIIHWLNGNGDIIAFNLNKEESRIFELPKSVSEMVRSADKRHKTFTWLELVEDEINLVVITQKHEVVVWVLYDYENIKWKIKREVVLRTWTTNSIAYIQAMSFDGDRLVLNVSTGYVDGKWEYIWQETDIRYGFASSFPSNSTTAQIYPNISTLTDV